MPWRAVATRVGLPLLLCLPAACERSPRADAATTVDPVAAELDAEFAARIQAARMAREEALVAPAGWTRVVGLHRIALRSHFVGSAPTSGIRLAHGPARLGLLQSGDDGVFLTPESGVALVLDGAPVRGRVRLRSDRDGEADVVGFDEGRGALSIVERGDAAFVRVWHADAEAARQFAGLAYWPIDRGWRIEAVFAPAAAGARIDVADLLGAVDATPTPGRVRFERDGVTHVLHALAGEGGGLRLVFADRTSGRGSYSAGRYLDTAAPDAEGRVVLDFNRAYNPPCAFSAFATCLLPPDGNRLDLAVDAGERTHPASR